LVTGRYLVSMVGAFSDCWRSMVWGIVLLEESKRMIDMQKTFGQCWLWMIGPVEIPCYLTFCYLAYGRVIGWLVSASISSHMFEYGFFFDLFE
jgi:hypothetical protein